jgi:hypothetical protein
MSQKTTAERFQESLAAQEELITRRRARFRIVAWILIGMGVCFLAVRVWMWYR